jgi:predicted N-formylglutamate amidohydrolase
MRALPVASSRPLLAPDEPAPAGVINPEGAAPVVLVCDHAANRVPRALGDLGLAAEVFGHHIAVDIGAAEITRHLARRLNAPAVLCAYSRLVIDCNRRPGDPAAIPAVTDGIPVPGNRNLTEAAVAQRVAAVFRPYHRAIGDALARQWRRCPQRPPALVAIHSFTPRLAEGAPRPWDLGLLWNRDDRLMRPLMAGLTAAGYRVGDNQPYSGQHLNYTCDRHALAAGLPHLSIELRQDRIAGSPECEAWASVLAEALGGVLGDPALHRVVRS